MPSLSTKVCMARNQSHYTAISLTCHQGHSHQLMALHAPVYGFACTSLPREASHSDSITTVFVARHSAQLLIKEQLTASEHVCRKWLNSSWLNIPKASPQMATVYTLLITYAFFNLFTIPLFSSASRHSTLSPQILSPEHKSHTCISKQKVSLCRGVLFAQQTKTLEHSTKIFCCVAVSEVHDG